VKFHSTVNGNSKSPQDRDGQIALTKMIMRLFELWNLTTQEQLQLLGLEPNARSTLARYRQPGAAFGSGRDFMDRVSQLLNIHKSLRLIFPHNPELVYQWPKSPNQVFGNKTPVQVMQEYGFSGVLMVRTYLDR